MMNEGAEEADLHWIERLYRLKSRGVAAEPGLLPGTKQLAQCRHCVDLYKAFSFTPGDYSIDGDQSV
jgi:hypothetical protein